MEEKKEEYPWKMRKKHAHVLVLPLALLSLLLLDLHRQELQDLESRSRQAFDWRGGGATQKRRHIRASPPATTRRERSALACTLAPQVAVRAHWSLELAKAVEMSHWVRNGVVVVGV
jgi:hypothetical protein